MTPRPTPSQAAAPGVLPQVALQGLKLELDGLAALLQLWSCPARLLPVLAPPPGPAREESFDNLPL